MATKIGGLVEFLGYSEAVDPAEDVMVVGTQYKVVKIDAKTSTYVLEVPNPAFDPEADVDDTNPEHLEVDAYFNEVKDAAAVVAKRGATKAAPEVAAKPVAEPAAKAKPAAKVEAEPVVKAKTGAATKPVAAAAKAVAKPAAKVAAKPAAKAKPKVAHKAIANAKGKTAAMVEAGGSTEEEDKYGALDSEDADIVELLGGTDDILQLAEELVEEGAALDYRLGGVLYHIRLSKAYHDVDGRYAEKGGFELYLQEHLNIEYRKAMYLVDIYYKFNLFGISGEKVAEIGWTKASKIARVMNEQNAGELVALAETSSVADLNYSIKESYTEVGATAGDKKRKVTFKFRLFEDQGKAVEEVLIATADAMGFKDIGDAFEYIVMEWAAEHPMSAPEEQAASKVTKASAGVHNKPAKAKAAAHA